MNIIKCNQAKKDLLNQNVVINGWIKKIRKLGSIIFLDLYDITGILQVFIDNKNEYYNEILKTPKESVVQVKGVLKLRSNINKNLDTGEFEVHLKEFFVYSKAKLPPFLIEDETDGLEELRLKYRYLDLRRKKMQQILISRSKILNICRNFLAENSFIEVETPYLSKQTPEGARDYLVPTRSGKFFALPQSPQIYKQLLMVSGLDRYFQFTRCFRDEDLRSDRQPEFTQLDIETSFLKDVEIQTIIEKMFKKLFKTFLNIDLEIPFQRMSYEYAMNNYGSDKPDIRFENKILHLNDYFKNTNFKIFKTVLLDKNNLIGGLFINDSLDKNAIKILEKIVKDNNAKGLAYLTIQNFQPINGTIFNVIEKENIIQICKDFNLENGVLFFVADKKEITLKALGAIRKEFLNLSKKIKLNKEFAFLWIVDWPLFEYSETENRYLAAHHPFTSPSDCSIKDFDTNPESAKGKSYDIVLNGYEIGGGSIRIYDKNIQKRMFEFLGLDENEIQKKFGFIINAFEYGVPPHGGIALGIERLLMIMLKTDTIRDVIAFPKNSSGIDLLFESPTNISNDLLKDLNLKNIK